MWREYTAENIYSESEEVITKMGLSLADFGSATQDTTGNSIHVFRNKDLEVIKCFAHLCKLMVQHGFNNSPILKAAIEAIKSIGTVLHRSNERKLLLKAACKETDVKFRNAVIDCETRWNRKEYMIRVFKLLEAALRKMDAHIMFDKVADKNQWNEKLTLASSSYQLLEIFVPFLTIVAQ